MDWRLWTLLILLTIGIVMALFMGVQSEAPVPILEAAPPPPPPPVQEACAY